MHAGVGTGRREVRPRLLERRGVVGGNGAGRGHHAEETGEAQIGAGDAGQELAGGGGGSAGGGGELGKGGGERLRGAGGDVDVDVHRLGPGRRRRGGGAGRGEGG